MTTFHPRHAMDAIPDAAETVLRRHPAPALKLGELLRLVRVALRDPSLGEDRLRLSICARPERFRLLDPWRGPWRRMSGPAVAEQDQDPWVVVVSDPGGEPTRSTSPSPAERLRSSVRWLAKGIDDSSTWSLARWHGVALAEADVRAHLPRAA